MAVDSSGDNDSGVWIVEAAQTATGWRCKVREAAEGRFTPVCFSKKTKQEESEYVWVLEVGYCTRMEYFIAEIIFIGIIILIIIK